jgi:hypothetical protein
MTQASSKRYLFLIALVVGQTICLAGDESSSDERRTWGASHMRELAPDGKKTRLALFDVSQGPQHLLGALSLTRQLKGKDAQLVIKGHFSDLGEFTPNVSLAVSDRRDGDWKTIESSLSESDDLTLTGAPHVEKLVIRIKLDAFQPFIGKFKYCRVTLQTGESDVFPMAWLTEKGE